MALNFLLASSVHLPSGHLTADGRIPFNIHSTAWNDTNQNVLIVNTDVSNGGQLCTMGNLLSTDRSIVSYDYCHYIYTIIHVKMK